MNELIQKFIDDTRDQDGAQTFVYLPDRGIMVNIDVCCDVALISAADERLGEELAAARAELEKARRRLAYLEGVAHE